MKPNSLLTFAAILSCCFGVGFWMKSMTRNSTAKSMDQVKNFFEEKRFSEAAEVLQKLVKEEYSPAYDSLAILHVIGEGVKKDDEIALELIKKSSVEWLKKFKNSSCNTFEAIYPMVIIATARDIEKMGYKEDAQRWYSLAVTNGYDSRRCPLY